MTIDKKKTIKVSLLIALFLIIILGTTYAFFNYTRTGLANTLSTSTILFDFTDDTLMDVSNDFPQESDLTNQEEVTMKSTHTGSLNISGHNTLSDGVKYTIYVVHGDDITGKQRLIDSSIKFQLEPNFTSGSNGFTVLSNNYSEPTNLSFDNEGKALISTGLVKDTTQLTTVGYNFYMWLDADAMHISSTMKRATLAEGNPSLADTTSGNTVADRYMKNDGVLVSDVTLFPASSNESGKIIYTTNEFSNGYYNIKFVVEAEDSPPPTPTPTPTATPEPFNSITYNSGCYTLTTLSNSTVKIDYYNYDYLDENNIEHNCPTNNIVIPSSFDGRSVTTIEDSAFSDHNLSGTLTIPNSVTTIGDSAFNDNSLSGTLIIPNSVTTIGDYAFSNNNLSGTLVIPNSVTTIGGYAFARNSGFTSVTIPNSVTSYDAYSFGSGDYNDTIVSLSIDVSTIYTGMFREMEIENLTLGDHVVTIGDYAFDTNQLTSITLPSSLTTIGEQAFYNNSLSGTLTIPNSVTTIDHNAFADNSGFTSVTIPNSVTSLDNSAFSDTSIESLSIDMVNIPSEIFSYHGIESLTLGEHVVTIGEEAFANNNISGNLIIPSSVTTLSDGAFNGNSSSITIPNSVTTIGIDALNGSDVYFSKSCSVIENMNNYSWGSSSVYGLNNEECSQ